MNDVVLDLTQKEFEEILFLEKQVKKLHAENQELKEFKRKAEGTSDMVVKSLEAENQKLRECVEFYADTGNWHLQCVSVSDHEHFSINDKVNLMRMSGGKRARQTLRELDE